MAIGALEDVYVKLEKIRAFDSLIDFSKSRIQLDIVLQLAAARKPLSADEIAEAIGQRKKPVLDALRKLELKGIIRRTEDYRNIYELTDLGKQMISDLTTILGASNLKEVVKSRMYGKIGARDLIKLIIPVHYLYEALVSLGTSKTHELPINVLAKATGISAQRLMVYLDPYSAPRSEVRLFKKYRKEDLITKMKSLITGSRRVGTVYYRPTKLGMELFYRLPIYAKVKNSKLTNIILKLFGYYNPKLVLHKVSLTDTVVGSALLVSLALLGTTVLPIVLGVIAARVVISALLMLSYGK